MKKMDVLAKEYAAEIRSWDWAAAKREAMGNMCEGPEGDKRGSVFIGTVFSLMPSGKYYQPFACSNIDPCPACSGTGSVRRRTNTRVYKRARKRSIHLRKLCIKRYGYAYEGRWPGRVLLQVWRSDRMIDRHNPKGACPYCDGIGSAEAAQDEVFQELLSEVANENDMWVESGEGDLCDVFLSCSIEEDEEETS